MNCLLGNVMCGELYCRFTCVCQCGCTWRLEVNLSCCSSAAVPHVLSISECSELGPSPVLEFADQDKLDAQWVPGILLFPSSPPWLPSLCYYIERFKGVFQGLNSPSCLQRKSWYYLSYCLTPKKLCFWNNYRHPYSCKRMCREVPCLLKSKLYRTVVWY